MRETRSRLIAAACAALAAGAAAASVALRASVEDLVEVSHSVVLGDVVDHAVSLDRAAGAVWTTYRVRVARTLDGAAAAEIAVRVPGGRVGEIEQETIGAARLGDGERVVLFLGAERDGAREVSGLAQGAFRVAADPRTGVAVCSNSLDGLSLVDRSGGAVSAEPLQLTLDELASRVVAARAAIDARRRAVREAQDRRLAAWRRSAERHAPLTRGRPGGAAD